MLVKIQWDITDNSSVKALEGTLALFLFHFLNSDKFLVRLCVWLLSAYPLPSDPHYFGIVSVSREAISSEKLVREAEC